MTLSDQVALVTGAGRGIGRAIALALVQDGARVALLARSREELEETAALAGDRSRVLVAPADITDDKAVGRVVERIAGHFGPVSLLVNNAATYAIGEPPLWEADLDTWWHTVEVNVRGPLVCMRAVLPTMLAERRGRVVTVASDLGALPCPLTAYQFSKAARIRLTEALGISLDEADATGVRTFAINPGSVRTRMTEPFAARFPDHDWTPAEESGRLVTALASGTYDALHGRYLSVHEDLDRLLERLDQVTSEELFVERMRVYGPDGSITTHWD
ncbi:SDR family oxidoreductase [Streptomyces sp. CA-210063]|uniref:SDR family NAD(P)-dependent oxidoreductase n=1 Tax=Streptomyces sp. CA-210063 TaxID=2801029 RepID=UPI00214ADAF2|nr:SDR family oxidoreductase [Streptomyces sp. CA-210063]UUU30201.1 SDR family oxidoreductase [Streptomyces sp. CA-210063]